MKSKYFMYILSDFKTLISFSCYVHDGIGVSYHFLCESRAKLYWMQTGSGSDQMAPLYAAQGDVDEEEAAALLVSNPSSLFSPERA